MRGNLHSKTSKGDTSAGSRGLVHLTEDKGDLGLSLEVDDTSLLHLVVQIVTLTSTLADTAEHGVTTVGLGDVVLEICQLKVQTWDFQRYSRSAPE
jgi:hypothetical protein